MKSTRFDGMTLSLNVARSRREALVALFGGLFGLFLTAAPDSTSAAKGKKSQRKHRQHKNHRPNNGPCGSGDKEGKDCRCKKQGDACTSDASCCPRTRGLSCQEGTCQPCDVCRSGCDFASVQSAIDSAASGDTIHICAGVFSERLVIEKNVMLIGVGDGTKGTTIDGGRDGTTVSVSNATVTLERLRITGGSATADGGGILSQKSNLTLTDCAVSGNIARTSGGGIATQDGALTLNSSAVADNEAGSAGGGLHHESGATTFNNSIVNGNEAGTQGGGIFHASGAMTLNDSRVEDNTAVEGGGIFRSGGALSLFDSIVTGNSPDDCVGVVCTSA